MPAYASPSNRDRHLEAWIPTAEGRELRGEWLIPADSVGTVVLAHGAGSSRNNPRSQFVARSLHAFGIATLVFDLLSDDEEAADRFTGNLRFDVELLAERLIGATAWLRGHAVGQRHRLGFYGAGNGGVAALLAAAELGDQVQAIVCRGGRPDLAGPALSRIEAATLLVVGSHDPAVLALNRRAMALLHEPKELAVVDGATHGFEDPGAVAQLGSLAATWFERHLGVLAPAVPRVPRGPTLARVS